MIILDMACCVLCVQIVEDIFGNVHFVENMATQLLGSIEDSLEMFGESGEAEDSKVPLIGACFEEPALVSPAQECSQLEN